MPLFRHLPTMRMTGAAAAAGIATINCFGNLTGFAGPIVFGWLKDRHHDAMAITVVYRRVSTH
ncbi:hypothetical protein CFB45_36745 [Burkholderia sp. HI2500]|nr:hypothetical protein CFB45_36745 [Burkholderia sp. HI2500]